MARKSIVITGCSSGFGRLTALELARLGWFVFATVRTESDRDSLLREATTHGCQENITCLLCDITQSEQVLIMAKQVQEVLRAEMSQDMTRELATASPGLHALLNNAGTAYAGPIELLHLDDLRAQLELNVVAQVAVTQALLPMLKAAHGTIISMSSISGKISLPITGAYSASKFALEAISDALRLELAPFGVNVVLVEPSSSPTNIWQTSLERATSRIGEQAEASPYSPLVQRIRTRALQFAQQGFPPQRIANLVVHILSTPRPRARYSVPSMATNILLLRRFIPDALWDRLVRLQLRW